MNEWADVLQVGEGVSPSVVRGDGGLSGGKIGCGCKWSLVESE